MALRKLLDYSQQSVAVKQTHVSLNILRDNRKKVKVSQPTTRLACYHVGKSLLTDTTCKITAINLSGPAKPTDKQNPK